MSSFLYEDIKKEFGRELRKDRAYGFVNDNLNPKIELREYQKEALNRFYLYCENDDAVEYIKPNSNMHLCFNMATGSGKTVIMSGAMLYLYEQGYRDFLFFVNRGQIVQKTKDNFVNSNSSKYLFAQKIVFKHKEVKVKAVDNFSESTSDAINICFTTIQGLYGDIHNQRENGLTLDDFKSRKIVLIADEAHHINASTKSKTPDMFKPSWENTVESIFRQNEQNTLLEFTATLELDNKSVKAKYSDKILYKYDLKEFVQDKYSKKIELFRSDTTKEVRVLQALILSVYRGEVANKYGLNIKPVVLLKSSKIEESKQNQKEFYESLERLSGDTLKQIKESTNIEMLQKAFEFFSDISHEQLAKKIQIAFSITKVLCTNDDKELEANQKLLNSLEDNKNPIRAIFTVDKLNEGWDVLNLFDIVRLYEGQSSGGSDKGKVGKKTISEAQLVGRGARYCPFHLEFSDELYRRKYDSDITNELRVLEELYFHSENESRYISEIKKALVDMGLVEDEQNEPMKLEVKLKNIHKTNLDFLNKKVFKNHKVKKRYDYVKNLSDFGIAKSNFEYSLKSGKGELVDVFDDKLETKELTTRRVEKNLVEFCSPNIIYNAILRNEYFTLTRLKMPLPNLKSISEFVSSKEYLSQFKIYLNGENIESIGVNEKLNIALSFLGVLEQEMKNNTVEFEGTKEFKPYKFADIFREKTLLVPKDKVKNIYENSDKWFANESFYGTSEEKSLIELIGTMIDEFGEKYKKDEIYLIRNERHFELYSFEGGRRFEPDFVLFLKDSHDGLQYQIFIEPKGEHLKAIDQWKEEFLTSIKEMVGAVEFENENYRLIGLEFYNHADENSFKDSIDFELLK